MRPTFFARARGRLGADDARNRERSSDARDARAAARDARDAYVRRLCDAWRAPSRGGGEPDAAEELLRGAPDPGDPSAMMARHLRTEEPDEAQARRDAAWAQYRDQLGNAWKIDPRAATAIERRGEQWRGGR